MNNAKWQGYFRLVIILCAGILFLAASSITTNSWAFDNCDYYYEALIDVDNNPSTGGTVHVVQEGGSANLPGIDYKVRAYLSLDTQTIHHIQIWTWNGSTFDQSDTPENYALGIGNGYQYNTDKADVVEFMASRAALGNPQGPMKIVYHASRTGSPANDYTAAFFYPERTTAVPSLSHWGIILLGLLLAISAIWVMRKRNSATVRVLCSVLLVLSIAGVVSANLLCPETICLDGLIEDWNEISATPSLIDPPGDSSINDDGEDIVAGYITSDTNNIYFRIDIVGGAIPTDCSEE
jgi:hypothetical protein